MLEKIAAELAEKRTLSGDEVRAIVEAEGGVYFEENEEITVTAEELLEQV